MPVRFRPAAARRKTALRLDRLEDRTVPAVAIGTNFQGITSVSSPYFPPDTNGAVGPNHIVEIVNGEYRVFNKSGSQLQTRDEEVFWIAAGLNPSLVNGGVGDPRVMYDPLVDRWFLIEFTVDPFLGNSILVGRSDGPNPAGTWKADSYEAVNAGTFGDYPSLAIDANGVYIGTVDFTNTARVGSTMTSIPKADLLLSTPTVANRTTRTETNPVMGDVLQGVTNLNPVAPDYASVVATDFFNFSQVNRTKITGTGGPNATFDPTTPIAVATTSFPGQSRQPDGSRQIDAIDDRFGSSVWQVGDLIFGVHSVSVNGSTTAVNSGGTTRNAVRMTVLRDSTNTVVAEATHFSTVFDYIDPSIAINAEGDFLIGFTRSAAAAGSGATNGNLGAYAVAGRIDPDNAAAGITFDPAGDIQLRAGLSGNYHPFGGSGERWGDYSATNVDPANNSAFWTFQEYASGAASWGTQVSQVYVNPRVSRSAGVSSTAANGTYTTGQVIPITVTFNGPVNVNTAGGTPTLALNPGGGAVATYASGSGTRTLTFNYTVGFGQAAADLDYTSATALSLNGGTIRGVTSNLDAILMLAAAGTAGSLGASKAIVIDTTPRVTGGVSATNANGSYGTGVVIHVTVGFSSPVTVNVTGGTPQVALNAGGGAVATYVSGSGTSTLTFDYTIAAGQAAADLDYTSATALTLNGGTIKDSTTALDAILTLPVPGGAGSLGANRNIVVDTTSAAVSGVTSTAANGPYGLGAVIPITVTFSRPVTVSVAGGTPRIALNAGAGAFATYASGSPSTVLTFNYTVGLGHRAPDLDYASTTALTLNGGTMIDTGNGNPADLILPAPGAAGSLGANKNLDVDGLPAQPSNITSVATNGSFGFGAAIPISITFSKPVVVNLAGGSPLLALNSGGTATYTGGAGTFTALTFSYTVALGDRAADLDYFSTTALTLNGSTIQDQASNTPAPLTLPAPGATGSLGANKDLDVDGRPAQPTNVTSTTINGTYGIGTVFPISVTFSKPVVVTGAPQLALNSGGIATYTGGAGTFTTLTFSYTVVAGDTAADLDYLSAAALTLNGGTIQDQASNTPAPLTLPAPGAAGSLGMNKNLVVDTTGPTVVEYRVKYGNRWYNLIGSPRFDVPWKVTGIQVVFDSPVTVGKVQSLTGITATKLTGLGTNTLTWKVAAILKGSFATALATTGPNALKDAGGNLIAPFSMPVNVLYGDFNDDQVVNALDEAGIRANMPAPYQPGSVGYNLFADLSGDGLVSLIDVGVARGRKGKTLP